VGVVRPHAPGAQRGGQAEPLTIPAGLNFFHLWWRRATIPRVGEAYRFQQPDDVFQIRVSLADVEPLVWRRLLVPQEVTLPRLHQILQVTMGWTDSHLHQFLVGDVRFAEPDSEFPPGPIDYRRITLNQIAPRPGAVCVYEYDFGDGWEHLVEVEQAVPAVEAGSVPRCVGGERTCPPEDCGGPPGYEELLRALRDPTHPEHEEYRQWVGPGFDPRAFDVVLVNKKLTRFAPRPARQAPRRPRRR
jgi:hypothetical protein